MKSSMHTVCPCCAVLLLHLHLFLLPFISNALSSHQMWWYKYITDVPSVCLGASFVFLINAYLLPSFLLSNWNTVIFLFSPSLLRGKAGRLNRGRAARIPRQRLCSLHSVRSTGKLLVMELLFCVLDSCGVYSCSKQRCFIYSFNALKNFSALDH